MSVILMIQVGRSLSDASLGSANVLYAVLKSLELETLADRGLRDFTFLAIEEPEAHLHPHLQRLLYSSFLKPRAAQLRADQTSTALAMSSSVSMLLTTHSPHVVSVSPIQSLVLLRRTTDRSTAKSAASIPLLPKDIDDLERYINVTRGEALFARAVLLVEGDAEEYLLPQLAKLIGYDLDQLGITVTSVGGTNFLPYVKLFGPDGLDIPFAVLTDNDPQDSGQPLAFNRVKRLLKQLSNCDTETMNSTATFKEGRKHGVFVNDHTLEVDLLECGLREEICSTLAETTLYESVRQRAKEFKSNSEEIPTAKLLKHIEAVGKGRFAQRLASKLTNSNCPEYISSSLEYLAQ